MSSDQECYENSNCNLSEADKDDDKLQKSQGHISITPQMLRAAVKRLHLQRAYVPSTLIGDYLRRFYPVESDPKIFKDDLKKKLDCAVHVGLLLKREWDAYYLPTLRQDANALKTAFTAFWEVYKKYPKGCTLQRKYRNHDSSIAMKIFRNRKSNKGRRK